MLDRLATCLLSDTPEAGTQFILRSHELAEKDTSPSQVKRSSAAHANWRKYFSHDQEVGELCGLGLAG